MITKKNLVDLWKETGFKASRSMGQNFLVDGNIKNKIISEIDPKKSDRILEIGPGFGELTMDLAERSGEVTAVEKDRRIAAILTGHILKDFGDNVTVVNADILEYDLAGIYTKIVGNLPYYITTPIIEKIFESGTYPEIFIMVQQEYADRMLAVPGTKDYSSLSCFVQFYAEIMKNIKVSRTCFFPVPKVDSCFLRLKTVRGGRIKVKDAGLLFKIIRSGFNQRRKTLRRSLCGQHIVDMDKEDLAGILKESGFNPDARPEDLSLRDFAVLADKLKEERNER